MTTRKANNNTTCAHTDDNKEKYEKEVAIFTRFENGSGGEKETLGL